MSSPVDPDRSIPPSVPLHPAPVPDDGDVEVEHLGAATPFKLYRKFGDQAIFIEPSDEQQEKLDQLCHKLTKGAPNATIDPNNMTITVNGKTTPLTEDEVKDLRECIGSILQPDSKKVPFQWSRSYHDGSRSAYTLNPSFQWPFPQRPPIEVEKLLGKKHLQEDRQLTIDEKFNRLKRLHLSMQLAERFRARVGGLKVPELGPEDQGPAMLARQSRMKKIEAAKEQLQELDQFVLQFEALVPLSEPTEKSLKAKEALAAELFKERGPSKAKRFAKWTWKWGVPFGESIAKWVGKRVGHPVHFEEPKPEDVEQACKELAVAGIEGRGAFLDSCKWLGAHPKKDTAEHLIIRLAAAIANGEDPKSILKGGLSKDGSGNRDPSGLFLDVFGDLDPADRNALCEALLTDCKALSKRAELCLHHDMDDIQFMQEQIAAQFSSQQPEPMEE